MADNFSDIPKVYLHVGLERTGTTFLQKNIFPYFQGIEFIGKKHFKNIAHIIESGSTERYLVSHEFNRGFKEKIHQFRLEVKSHIYPIITLRRHDEWLLSIFKRDIKNGFTGRLEDYFPLNGDGFLNKDALDFHNKITLLQDAFDNQPLVLFYDELVANPTSFIERISLYCKTSVSWEKVTLSPIHTSYSEHQLTVLHAVNRKLLVRWLKNTKAFKYALLHLADMTPRKWSGTESLFNQTYLTQIRERYATDWKKCLEWKNHSV